MYTVSYPINVLNGKIPRSQLAAGPVHAVRVDRCYVCSWPTAVAPGGRRYVAVGG